MTVAPRDRDVILADLGRVAADLADTNARAASLYADRLALLQEGRALPKPITQRELAATAGVTEEAVIQVLRKAARQAAEVNGK